MEAFEPKIWYGPSLYLIYNQVWWGPSQISNYLWNMYEAIYFASTVQPTDVIKVISC